MCSLQQSLHNVIMGDAGAFWVSTLRRIFYLQTSHGVLACSLGAGSWRWDGRLKTPTLTGPVSGLCKRHGTESDYHWYGELRAGRLFDR